MTVIVIFLFAFFSKTTSQTITIDPSSLQQQMVFGGDAKLTIKDWAEGNVNTVAQKLYGDMDLKILRVPIFALQAISDSIYYNVITIINAVKTVNPEVKIFASVANGDGYDNNNLHNSDKFPADWKGCCPYNIYSLNLTAYAAYLDSFINRMQNAGITINYLGPWNEDNADDSDHRKVFDQMIQLGNIKKIGLELWGLQTSINNVDDVEDQVDIIGSHFFYDQTISENNWNSKWATLVLKSEDPVWFTESTRFKTTDSHTNLLNGLDHIFPAIRGGAESVIFYQVCKRFVYANGTTQNIKYTGFQNIVNHSNGYVINSNSTDVNLKVVVFGKDNILNVHVLNRNSSDNTISIQLQNNSLANGLVQQKIWNAQNTGSISKFTVSNASNIDTTIPAEAYVHFKIPLNNSILGSNSNNMLFNQVTTVYPNPNNGTFQIKLAENQLHHKKIKIKLYSLEGKMLFEKNSLLQNQKTITFNEKLSKGIYLLTIVLDASIQNHKMVINSSN